MPRAAEGDPVPEPRRVVRIDRRIAVLVTAVVAAAALGAGAASLPDVSRLRGGWPDTTAYMELRIREARERGRQLGLRYRPVPLGRIPDRVRRAVLVSEDAAFYRHSGIDLRQVRAALEEAWRQGRLTRGASTITQQLARNLYLSPERSLARKLREAVIALRLESELSKDRILELYLNVIELGDGVFGVAAGSAHYFGRPIGAVSRRQAAMLAATVPAPRTDNPSTRTAEFRWRADLVYRRAFGPDGADPADSIPADEVPVEPGTLPAPDSVPIPAADTVVGGGPDTVAAAGPGVRAPALGARMRNRCYSGMLYVA